MQLADVVDSQTPVLTDRVPLLLDPSANLSVTAQFEPGPRQRIRCGLVPGEHEGHHFVAKFIDTKALATFRVPGLNENSQHVGWIFASEKLGLLLRNQASDNGIEPLHGFDEPSPSRSRESQQDNSSGDNILLNRPRTAVKASEISTASPVRSAPNNVRPTMSRVRSDICSETRIPVSPVLTRSRH